MSSVIMSKLFQQSACQCFPSVEITKICTSYAFFWEISKNIYTKSTHWISSRNCNLVTCDTPINIGLMSLRHPKPWGCSALGFFLFITTQRRIQVLGWGDFWKLLRTLPILANDIVSQKKTYWDKQDWDVLSWHIFYLLSISDFSNSFSIACEHNYVLGRELSWWWRNGLSHGWTLFHTSMCASHIHIINTHKRVILHSGQASKASHSNGLSTKFWPCTSE